MNLYIHIPFCNNKCKYCRFASLGNSQKFFIQKYINFLEKEILDYKTPKKQTLETIYFGGGTPGILEAKDLKKIFLALEKKFYFDKNIEISFETTPDNINIKNLISWEKLGINRISIGIQTLNNKSLKEIGRGNNKIIFNALDEIKKYISLEKNSKNLIISTDNIPKNLSTEGFNPLKIEKNFNPFMKIEKNFTSLKNKNNFNSLKNKKIKNFSLDFIIGLPYTKKGETKKDIEKILKKYDFITHISVYMLEDYYEVETLIEEKNSFEKITYPNSWQKNILKEDYFLGEYIEVKNFLQKNNFKQYEISNFGKIEKNPSLSGTPLEKEKKIVKNYKCKHNIGYWTHKETIGFGLSASSFIKDKNGNFVRFSNSSNFLEYYKKILEEKYILKKEDIFLEKIMFGLRTNGIEKNLIKNLNNKKILEFIELGFLAYKKEKLVLKDKGVLVLDYIIKEII